MNNKLMGSVRSQQELMDGYDVIKQHIVESIGEVSIYRVYQIQRPKVGKPVKIYRFGYPDYKSMIQKHPELKVLQLT